MAGYLTLFQPNAIRLRSFADTMEREGHAEIAALIRRAAEGLEAERLVTR